MASPTLPGASSMKVAGRKIEASTSMPARPGGAGERLPRRPGHVERAGARELLDDEEQAGAVVDDRVADQRLVILDHVRDVRRGGDRRRSVDRLDRELRPVGGRDRQDVLDAEPLVGRVDEAAGAGGRRLEEGQRRDPQGVAGRLMTCSATRLARAAGPGRPAPAADARAGPRSRRWRRRARPSAAA